MLNKNVTNILDKLIEVYVTQSKPPDYKIGHRSPDEKKKEKEQRKSPEYKRRLQDYLKKRKLGSYRPNPNISKASEKSARLKRNYLR